MNLIDIPDDILKDADNFYPHRDKGMKFLLRKGYIAGRLIERRMALDIMKSMSGIKSEHYTCTIEDMDTNLYDDDLNDEK